jgi:predicted GNAT family acetyltransferase
MEIEVLHDPDNKEFYFSSKGMKAFLSYEEINTNTLEFYHTYVPPALRKQGVAGKILRKAAEYARNNKKNVIPTCSYAASYFEKNPEFNDILHKQ